MAGIVVVFDFDKTIIDVDSDNWVVDNLGAADLFQRLLPTMPWNTLMDVMMKELHSRGKTIEDIKEVLKRAPLDPHVISTIKQLYALGCDLRVVSDANMFFIETILKYHGVLGCFSEINTNPSYVDEQGKLRIFPYHEFTISSHGCSLCPPNMCKGMIIERMLAELGGEGTKKKQLIYLGDGKGDYCPSLKLREGDIVMPRKNYPVWELITTNIKLIRAQVHEWSDFEEQQRILFKLIHHHCSSSSNGNSQCHFQTAAPMVSALPPALPVRH
ncbi:inorganic pyrophosphatase 1-like [Iris pallida]|uniref:Inorganic pyrophosphatase 1-like n=1 Tax=Iris pallida TaxID=29817 RepID=A0AAX6FIQ3_IRIPA|nr:inorganic pyrophosphatase 1-like [Iris pallida]